MRMKQTALCCVNRSIILITQWLHFINRSSPLAGRGLGSRVAVRNVNDGFALDVLHATSPIRPVLFAPDQNANQHAWVDFPYVDSPQSGGVARLNVVIGILVGIGVVW